MFEHEYALIGGINRAQVGRYLAIAASIVSGAIVFVVLSMVDLAKRLGWNVNLPPTALSLVGAGAVFLVLYWLFDRHIWRWRRIGALLKVPDLRGEWNCVGRTLNQDGSTRFEWSGTVTIVQTWDKLRVRLRTKQSGSNSMAAALLYDEADGFRLLYNYRNDPRIGESELSAHLGCAEVVFSKDLKSGEGEYFNGHGRNTFGTMYLTRA